MKHFFTIAFGILLSLTLRAQVYVGRYPTLAIDPSVEEIEIILNTSFAE